MLYNFCGYVRIEKTVFMVVRKIRLNFKYAENCSWKAGKSLASRMKDGKFKLLKECLLQN